MSGQRIIDGLNDALAFVQGDASRATLHTVDVRPVDLVAAAIWRETYRHDTLLNWHEVKRGTMHHKRVMAAARAVLALKRI